MLSVPEKPLAINRNGATPEAPSLTEDLSVFWGFYTSLLKDFSNLNLLCEADILRDSATLRRRIESEGITFVTVTLPRLFDGILNTLEGRDAIFPSFKTKIYDGIRVPVLLNGLSRIALNKFHHQQSSAFNALYQICVAFKKLKGPYKPERLKEQFADFIRVDGDLKAIDLDAPYQSKILSTARKTIEIIFRGFNLKDRMRPRPGPGSTCTPSYKSSRYAARWFFPNIHERFPYQEFFYPTPLDAGMDMQNLLQIMQTKRIPCARYGFVPKTYDKARGICMEENEVQFFQQGVRIAIEEWLAEKHPDVWLMINTHDQKRNQLLAYYASINRKKATIDESEASDRIWRELVRSVWRNTNYCDDLMALSTQFIKVPPESGLDGYLKTQKFAPMGSGLCFPIMTLLHWALIRSIMLHSGIRNSLTLSREVSVYGDDIVIPSQFYREVTTRLPLFGMKINVMKSYVASGFRESCGLHAFNGVVVTPVYLKYIPKDVTLKGRVSLYAAIGDLYKKGFPIAASFLQDLCPITPYSIRSGLGLFGVVRDLDNRSILSQYRTRWSSELQCQLYHVPRLVKKGINVEMAPVPAYLRWLTVSAQNSSVADYHDDYKISWSWVPSHTVLSPTSFRKLPVETCVDKDVWSEDYVDYTEVTY